MRAGSGVLRAMAIGLAMSAGMACAQEATLSVFAVGSLRGPITQAARAFEQANPGTRIALTFGA